MNKNQLEEYVEGRDELDGELQESQTGPRVARKRESKRREADARLFIRAQEAGGQFKFTYKAARFEEAWLLDALLAIADQQWITDVLRKAKGGKEASVYLCKTGPAIPEASHVAAKIYRPRALRNLKDDHEYRVGRVDLGVDGKRITREADIHAIAKRTTYGEELRHQSWIAYEFNALEVLFKAGADVPRPYALAGNAILMDFVGDELGSAPTLNEVALERAEALVLFERVMQNVETFLKHGFVHGDLSAYNILYWHGDITLIDLPQVVSPTANPNAYRIFARDVKRLCDYFAKQGVDSDPRRLARDLWAGTGHAERGSPDPRFLDPEDPRDRQFWEKESGQKR